MGRLHETDAEIESRYGSVLKTLPKDIDQPEAYEKFYDFNGYRICVAFLNGKSVCEMLKKPDSSYFDDGEVMSILNANSFGSVWKKISSTDTGNAISVRIRIDKYTLQSGEATASVHNSDDRKCLTIQTPDFEKYLELCEQLKEKRKQKKLQEF